jgi:septation ring formation regulator EzrA
VDDIVNKKIDKIIDDVQELKITAAKQEVNHSATNAILERITASVEYHIKRTDKLEELVNEVRKEATSNNTDLKEDITKELKPIKTHITFVKGALWSLGILSTLAIALLKVPWVLEKLLILFK